MTTPLLELRDITKAFGDLVANDRISLSVMPGRVHALVGENGAGKTTLMTMVAGTAQPDSGRIVFDGREVEIASPHRAASLGIGMVHQHFKLVPSLTVAANVFLGRELRTQRGTLDTAAMEDEVAELSRRFGLAIDPKARISSLSVGLRQRVEVLKALSHDTRLLILDEPTAVLTPQETDELFVVVRDLARKGRAVLFISHKLGEVLEIADDVTVIRDGQVIDTRPAAGLSQADIAQMMVGREVLLRIAHTPATPGDVVLSVEDLTVVDDRGVKALTDLSLPGPLRRDRRHRRRGGQRPERARCCRRGHAASGRRAHRARRHRRHERGGRPPACRGARLHPRGPARGRVGPPPLGDGERDPHAPDPAGGPVRMGRQRCGRGVHARAHRAVRHPGATPATPISSLSGGNMQKVIIAREFASEPRLLAVSQPTRGVDVGAMEFVHNAIVARRDAGAGVLLLSADLNEVMSLSDRLLVMHRGRIVAEFTQETMSEAAVGLAMAGTAPTEEDIARAREQHERTAAAVATSSQDAPVAGVAVASPGDAARDAASASGRATRSRKSGSGAPETWSARLARGARRSLAASVQPVVAIVLALLIGMGIILALGENPLDAYDQLFFSSFRTPFGVAAFLAQFIPLVVLAAAVIVSFRAGFFNIGGEGQLFLGAFTAAWAGFTFTGLPGPVLTLVVLLAGFVGGMVWGFIPGLLLALWRVDIIVTTLMMSSIAALLTAYLVTGPFKDPTAGMAASAKIAPDAHLPLFVAKYGIGADLLIALAIAVVLGLILTRSTWGLNVRQLGEMNRFAEYTGVSAKKMSVQVMSLAGGAAGLAGAIFVLGPNGGRFLQNFSPGYGFLGITVALLARLNPWAAIVAAAFYANMMSGANGMQINTDVPFPLVNVLQGIIILIITAVFVIDRRTRERVLAMLPFRRRGAPASEPGSQTAARQGDEAVAPVAASSDHRGDV